MADGMLKWVTVFDKDKEKGDHIDIPDIDAVLANDGGGDKKKSSKDKGGNKRLSVERLYQKKTQLEHILLRPDTYIGSVETVSQMMWVYDDELESMVQREITYVPGLYKIFDEILVNAADNKQRDKNMTAIKIDIDAENNKIKIWNNGKGIPVVEHKTEKMYVPTLIFGHLLTSSNFDDSQKKVTGGRNGYGAKLCNIFSNKFVVETQSSAEKKAFKQSWSNNMVKASEPKILPAKGEDYTSITFHPDLTKFKMDRLDKDTVALFTRRAYDIAASSRGVKVFLNGKKLPIRNFKDYVEIYIKGKVDDLGSPLKVVHEVINDRWEIAVTMSEKGFQQVSFVNSIATTKGGRHVDYITDHLVSKIIEVVKKKEKKGGIQIKPFQVKNHVWVFINCLIENPTFDSQTKETMTLQAKNFGSKCQMPDKFITNVSKCGIVESVMSWMKFKQQAQLNKKMSSAKHSKLKGIPKLDDANNAGTKNSIDCTLILTEGDSAKTLAVAGLGVVGRDRYGVFPLKGKVLNVREATHKQIMENAETNNIIKILGLRYKEKYDTPESLRTLRYGKLMIMTDQDQDGSHIKGLLINFIHHNWPNLLKQNFLEEFITPIVKVTKNKQEKCFYSLPEFEEWKKETDNWHTYKVKYYKGLGTSTSKEAKEYFSDMHRHRIPFKYAGTEDDASIVLAFSRKKIEERKEWLTNWMEERKRRAQLELPEIYLYGKHTKSISYNEFVNRELILFSNMDNERSIPSLVDGFKPGQRKVFFTCLKRNITKEVKVAQLAGSVGEHSAYHHGEASLMATIINLAQNFVGSNNINILQPIGQFGTRLHGGKDAASPRYIFTSLSPLARHLFNPNDDPLLRHMYDDNLRIEPEWYMPIIPMVLVNGAQGIGTGWSTNIPNYDPRELVTLMLDMMEGGEPVPMLPSFKSFRGTVEELDETRYIFNGEVSIIDDQTIEISELPIRSWTQTYKENVLEPMLQGTEKTPAVISDYKEYHTDTTVRFVVKMSAEKLARAEEQGLHKYFKLQSTMSTASMVLFDSNGCIKRYTNVEQIIREFFDLRLDYYRRRKDYMEGMLAAESLKLDNVARFICEKIDGTIVIENKTKKDVIQTLTRRGYDPDPVKTWKEAQNKLQALEELGADENDDSQSSVSGSNAGPDYNYLLNLPMLSLTKEKKDELLKNRDQKAEELYQLRKKSPKDLWKFDLNAFKTELDQVEQKERDEEAAGVAGLKSKAAAKPKGRARIVHSETKPSPMGRRVEPRIDPALRAKAEAAAAKKRKAKEKKEAGPIMVDDDMFNEDSNEPKSLADRIGMKSDKLGTKQPNIQAAFTKAAQKKKVAQKLVIDSDSDFDDAVKIESSPMNGDSSITKVSPSKRMELSPKKRERKKKTSGNKRPRYSDASDVSDFSDTEFSPSKKRSKKKGGSDDEFDLDDSYNLNIRPTSREGRSRKPVKYNFGDDNSDREGSGDDHRFPDSDDESVPVSSNPPQRQQENDESFSEGSDKEDMVVYSDKEDLAVHSDKEDMVVLDDSPVKAPRKKPATVPKPYFDESGSDEDFKMEEDSPEPKKKAKSYKIVSEDDSDDWGAPKKSPKKAAPKKAAAPRKKANANNVAGDKPKKAPPKKRAPKKKAESDDEDDIFGEKPKKAAPKKRAPKKTKPKFSDSENDDFMAISKSTAYKGKADESDDEFCPEEEVVQPRARAGGRGGAKQIKYNFGESSNDDDDDDY